MRGLEYYRLWLRTAFSGALDRAALLAFVVLALYGAAQHFDARLSGFVEPWVWAVPFWALAVVVGLRTLWAPYRIWKDNQAQIVALVAPAAIPAHALLIFAEVETDLVDTNKATLNLRVRNTSSTALAIAGILGLCRINGGNETPITCKGYLLHGNGGQCSYQFALADSLKEPSEGAIKMAFKLTYGLPDHAPSRALDQALTLKYQNLAGAIFSQSSTTAYTETEI
jgi:hypothetical protein